MKNRLSKFANSALFVAVMAGCAILTSARSALSAHLVEPTTDPPPPPPPPPQSQPPIHETTYSATGPHQRDTLQLILSLRAANEPSSMGSSLSPSSSSADVPSLSLRDLSGSTSLSRSNLAASAEAAENEDDDDDEQEEEATAQSQQQINQQHARSHHNHNQHQQQMPTTDTTTTTTTGMEAQMIEQILAAKLREHRRWRQQQINRTRRQRSDSMRSQNHAATEALESSLALLSPTAGFILSSGINKSGRHVVRRLIKRSGISDQKLAEMQMIRALKKQSERAAASSRLIQASNLSTANLADLAST